MNPLVIRGVLPLATFVSAMVWIATAHAQTPVPVETPPETPAPESSPEPTPTAEATPVETPVAVPQPTPTAPLRSASAGVIGGYGEVHYTNLDGREGANVDVHRLVVRVSNRYSESTSFRFAASLEHGDNVDLEEVALEYSPRRWIGVRGGVLLIPVGLLNTQHDPEMFHGVERNRVDTWLIPTTWREAGVSVFGVPVAGVHLQLAIFNSLNAGGFSGATGFRGGRGKTAESATNASIAARVDYSPKVRGLDLGVSYFEGPAGRPEIDDRISVRLLEADIRFQRMGIGLRGQFVRAWIEGAEALDDYLTTGLDPVAPVGSALEGYYLEAAYDVFDLPRSAVPALGALELLPFLRYEHTNTQLDMPGAYPIDDAFDRSIATAGLTFRPMPKIALKADYQWTWAGAGDPPNVWHLGIGCTF